MASLSDTGNLGSGSASSLIRSANTTATELETLDTNIADQQWEDSAKTQADYTAYTTTINGLLTKAQGDTTISGQDRVITLQNKLTSASNAYNTAQIDNASTQILLGNETDSNKVNLLGQLIGQAADPAEQNKLVGEYYSAVKAANDAATTAANTATAAASTDAEKGYTANNTMLTTLTSQLAASLKTGTNQISPSLLSGNTTFYVNPKTGQASATPAEGAVPVSVSVPQPGQSITESQYLHLYSTIKQLQYSNNVTASNDPNLTADEQASHASTAASQFDSMQSDVPMNVNLLNATADNQAAFIRSYTDGVPELKANTNVVAGRYVLNPTTASINTALSTAKASDAKTGKTTSVDFNVMVNGFATTYKLQNVGNAVIAMDPSSQFSAAAKTFLYDPAKGGLVPFNAQHQAEFTNANTHGGDITGIVNEVAAGYEQSQQPAKAKALAASNAAVIAAGNKPGSTTSQKVAGASQDIKESVHSLIQIVGSKVGAILKPAPAHDPLGLGGNGIVGQLGKDINGAALSVDKYLGNLVGGSKQVSQQQAAAKAQAVAKNLPQVKAAAKAPAPAAPVKSATPPSVLPAVTHTTTAKTVVNTPAPGVAKQAENLVGAGVHDVAQAGKAIVGGAESLIGGIGHAIGL